MLFPSLFTPAFLRIIFSSLLGLSACTSIEKSSTQADASVSAGRAMPLETHGSPWIPTALPGKRKTQFNRSAREGRDAFHAVSNRSASMLRRKIHRPAAELGLLQFSWQTPMLIAAADMADRDAEDAVVRVILSFEGDRSQFSNKNKMLSELSQALTGEELPYATLMYVWCNTRPVGTIITNPRTDRIRKMVLESGPANLGKWLDYERDIRADFVKAFGEEPGALTGIALMTDTDNTQSKATAWYGPVSLKAK
jgi:hypothetical protein